jgi:hypothetical protein
MPPLRREGFLPIKPRQCSAKERDYAPTTSTSLHENRRVSNYRHLSLLKSSNLSASIPGDSLDRRYFQLFHEQYSFDICGYFQTPFWTRLILQECHREPAIRHQVLALSALCKSISSEINPPYEHRQYALVQQNKALGFLRKSLTSGSDRVRLALIATMVLGCIESLHGNWETASQQICSGVSLLRHLKMTNRIGAPKTTPSNYISSTFEPELYQVVVRHELQAMSFLMMNPISDHPLSRVEDEREFEDIPDQFMSFDEVLPAASALAIRSLLHMRRCAPYKISTTAIKFPDSIIREQDVLEKAHVQWRRAFQPLLLKTGLNANSHEHLGALQFDMCVRVFKIMTVTGTTTEETVFDGFVEQFRISVSLCRHILQKDQELQALDSSKIRFGMGLIMSLFYIATRCRDCTVRHEAISLLRKSPSKNGIWDSIQAAEVADWVVSIEENHCDKNNFIPEGQRVKTHTLKWIEQGEFTIVECMKGTDGILKLYKTNLLRRPAVQAVRAHSLNLNTAL